MKLKKLFFLLILFSLSNCSKMFGPGALEKSPDFDINVTSSSGQKMKITILGSKNSSGQGSADYDIDYDYDYDDDGNATVSAAYIEGAEYFWGYYVYINDTNPYDSFSLKGFTGRSYVDSNTPPLVQTGFYKQNKGFSEVYYMNTLDDHFLEDTCSIPGKTYYYRVAEVLRTFECDSKCKCSDTSCLSICSCNGSWDGDGRVDRVSAWKAVTCMN